MKSDSKSFMFNNKFTYITEVEVFSKKYYNGRTAVKTKINRSKFQSCIYKHQLTR